MSTTKDSADEWVSHPSLHDSAPAARHDFSPSAPPIPTNLRVPLSPSTKRVFSQCSQRQFHRPEASAKPTVHLQMSLYEEGKIAVKTKWYTHLVSALKSVAGREWNPDHELWIFPKRHVKDVVRAIFSISELQIEVQLVHPLTLARDFKVNSSPSKNSRAKDLLLVEIFQAEGSRVGTVTPYAEDLCVAFKSVRGHEWDETRKVWFFPEQHLGDIIVAVKSLTAFQVEVLFWEPLQSPHLIEDMSGRILSLRLFKTVDGLIGARNQYHDALRHAYKSVFGHTWNEKEGMWTFPSASLDELLHVLHTLSLPMIKIEADPPSLLLPFVPLEEGNRDSNLVQRSEDRNNVEVISPGTPIKDKNSNRAEAYVENDSMKTGMQSSPRCNLMTRLTGASAFPIDSTPEDNSEETGKQKRAKLMEDSGPSKSSRCRIL